MNARDKLIDMAENGQISWEMLAREALEYLSTDECQEVGEAPGWLEPDGE